MECVTNEITIKVSKESFNQAPSTNGIYIFRQGRKILYIGKSVNLKARLLSHLENSRRDRKEAQIIGLSDNVELVVTDSEFKALLLEAKLINRWQPKYNVIWRDDKSNLYVNINLKEKYPKIVLVRKTDIRKSSRKIPGNNYYGPFPSGRSLEAILKEIRKIFPFCCQKEVGRKACFYSKIGMCYPCPGSIEALNADEEANRLRKLYNYNLRQIDKIFQGKIEPVLRELYSKLKKAAADRQYEDALVLRNKIYQFEKLLFHRYFLNADEPAYNLSEERQSSLETLLKPYYPEIDKLWRIECYDISNLGLEYATGSMVVFTDGLVDKSQYRRFRIKTNLYSSDFEMFHEVIGRRIKNKNWPKPDLIVIDGGKPQLKKVESILSEHKFSVPLIGIAKKPDRIVIGKGKMETIRTDFNHPGFNLIRALRDEAHRFARKYHLFLRDRNLLI